MQMLVHISQAVKRCWAATDRLFATIEDWSVQPIDVRRPFGFYYGHMASFAKLKMLPHVSYEAEIPVQGLGFMVQGVNMKPNVSHEAEIPITGSCWYDCIACIVKDEPLTPQSHV